MFVLSGPWVIVMGDGVIMCYGFLGKVGKLFKPSGIVLYGESVVLLGE